MRRVGLIVYEAPTREECEAFVRENPHPPWNGGVDTPESEHVAACSGPLKIVHRTNALIASERWWKVIAEHEDELVQQETER